MIVTHLHNKFGAVAVTKRILLIEPFFTTTSIPPVSWREVADARKKSDTSLLTFETSDVLRRVKKKGDLFAPVLALKQRLPSYQRTSMNTSERQ